MEIHLLGISMTCRWVPQPPPNPLLDLMMNSCFGTCFLGSFPENLTMTNRQFVSHPLFSGIMSQRYPNTDQILISVRYGGWDNSPWAMMLVLWWPGNMMSCLTPLAGGPIIIISSARITILPGGNCKTYFISCSWWIFCVSKVRPLLEDPANAISKHVCGTPIFNNNIWSTMQNSLYQLSKHCCMGNVIKFLPPFPKGFSMLYPVMDIMLWLSLGRIYPWNMCLNTFSFPSFCLIW